MTRTGCVVLWIAVAWAAVVQADDAVTSDAISEAGLTGGLSVFAGQSNGAREIEHAQTGRWAVLTIVPDEASSHRMRDTIDKAGLSGLVTAAPWQSTDQNRRPMAFLR